MSIMIQNSLFIKRRTHMKKLLVMLLAVSMVLSMAFAFAACDGNETENSTDSSVAEENSTEASKEESKNEASDAASVDTTVAPSEDASDETSEETSEPESSAVAYEYKTSAPGTNYSTNATYTIDRDGDIDPANIYLSYTTTTDWADAEHTKLKDGVVGDASTYNPTSGAQAGVTVQCAGTDKTFNFIFDLGDHYGDIQSIVMKQVRDGIDNGNNRGFKLRLVQISDDGENWTRVTGTESRTQVANAITFQDSKKESENVEHFDITYTLDAVASARYVKVVLSNNSGYVLQLEEMEIRN